MSTFQHLRRISFWTIDFLQNRKILKHLNEIYSIQNDFSSKNSVSLQKKNLDSILNHAVRTTPFYKFLTDFSSINDFPVINKLIVKNNYDSFISSHYKHNKEKLYKVSSSGSTGIPITLLQGKTKRLRSAASLIYFFQQTGFEIGQRLYVFEVWSETEIKSKFYSWLRNLVNIDVLKLTDENIKIIINSLKKDKSPKGLIGFPSAFESITKYLEKNNLSLLNCNITSITTNSEALNDLVRKNIEKYFGVTPVSRYSNEEFGILAQQKPNESQHFKINWANQFIEIFDIEKDEPVPNGTPGRVIVTDLFNYAMPMIRYDTGDIATMKFNEKTNEFVLSSVEGRKMDQIYDTNDNLISSFAIYKNLTPHYSKLKQYQFIQEDQKKYTIKLNSISKLEEKDEGVLVRDLKLDLGNDAQISIEYVNKIPLLPSGKTRKVVNNYK